MSPLATPASYGLIAGVLLLAVRSTAPRFSVGRQSLSSRSSVPMRARSFKARSGVRASPLSKQQPVRRDACGEADPGDVLKARRTYARMVTPDGLVSEAGQASTLTERLPGQQLRCPAHDRGRIKGNRARSLGSGVANARCGLGHVHPSSSAHAWFSWVVLSDERRELDSGPTGRPELQVPKEVLFTGPGLREMHSTRVVGAFPDGQSALMLVAARLRHVAGTKWGIGVP